MYPYPWGGLTIRLTRSIRFFFIFNHSPTFRFLALPMQTLLNEGVLVEIQVQCPHCGEVITTTADTSQGDYSTIEDCEVCCAPMNIEVTCEPGQVESVTVTPA
jgi:hypothetical protein